MQLVKLSRVSPCSNMSLAIIKRNLDTDTYVMETCQHENYFSKTKITNDVQQTEAKGEVLKWFFHSH